MSFGEARKLWEIVFLSKTCCDEVLEPFFMHRIVKKRTQPECGTSLFPEFTFLPKNTCRSLKSVLSLLKLIFSPSLIYSK